MIRTCGRCGAATRRPRYCSDQCAATARQQRLRAKDCALRAVASIDRVSVGVTIALLDDDREVEDDREIDPEVQRMFDDEIERGNAMRRALRRKRRPIPYRIDAIGRDDLAALDDDWSEAG